MLQRKLWGISPCETNALSSAATEYLLLDRFANYYSSFSFVGYSFQKECNFFSRVEALAFKVWCDCITNMIQTAAFDSRSDNAEIGNQYVIVESEQKLLILIMTSIS